MSNESGPFNPAKRKRHAHTTIEDEVEEAWPLVMTPSKPWHYALEYPVTSGSGMQGPVSVSVEMTVLKGEVGIACMTDKNTILNQTARSVDDGRTTVTLSIDDFSQLRSVMIRNGGRPVRSAAQIHSLSVSADSAKVAKPLSLKDLPDGDLDLKPFSPGNRIRHSDSSFVEDGVSSWPLVVTPIPHGHYAVEFPVDFPFLVQEPLAIKVDLTVLRGGVDTIALGRNARTMVETFTSSRAGRTTATLVVQDFSQCRSLIVKNADPSGRSVVQIHDITVSRVLPEKALVADQSGQDELVPQREPRFFEPDTRRIHPDVSFVEDGEHSWPLLVTSPTEWNYAVEFYITRPHLEHETAQVTVDLTVLRGEVGIGCLERHDKFLCEASRSAEDGRCSVTLLVEDFSKCQAIVIRNGINPARSVVQIHGITVSLGVEIPETPLLVVSADTFSRYPTWSGSVPPGFTGDWLGVLTRGEVESSGYEPQNAQALLTERIGSYPPPTDSELLMDWEPLLAAVELAGPKFTAVALGAGWGRWIVGCAFAAQKRGRDYHIVGVEAEPQHFSWMERHLADNNIPPEKSRLIRAAANSYTGTCWFMVGNATDWYGQAVVSDSQYRSAEFQEILRSQGATAEGTPCVDLYEVFAGLDRVDYLHLDIQGSEADVLLACPELLDQKVAVVNIGSHSEIIERRLRRHFTERGWLCRYDIPMNGKFMACLEGNDPALITVGDGVLVWENPRLTKRSEVEPFIVPTLIRG